MNLFDFLLQKKENRLKEWEAQHSTVMVEDPQIRHLEQQIEQLQQDLLQKEEVYTQLHMKLVNYEKLEETGTLAELEKIKFRYHKLEEENAELAKRPSLADYNYKNTQIQQLAMRLKKIKQLTVAKEAYEQLEQEKIHLKQALHMMTTKIERLENIISDYEGQNSDLQWQLEQLESKQAMMIDATVYDELEKKYNVLYTAHNTLQAEHEQQLKQNELLHLQIQQLQAQIEQIQQSATETVIQHPTPETDDLQAEVVDLLAGELSAASVASEKKETPIEAGQAEVIEGLEETPVIQLIPDEEEMKLAFDEVFLEEVSDENEPLVEQEVDETQMIQTMSEVLLKTVPTIDEGVTATFPVYDASSFLPRDDESEYNYLRRVINKLNTSMHEIQKIDFNNTYEIDYATAYADGIIRKRFYEDNRRLQYMKERPYIARVDYVTEVGAETMYIGEQGIDGHVISWKAEAASLYYLRTVGQPIVHQTLGEVIVDYIRQIDIEFGRIKTLHPPITATSQYFKDEGLVSSLANKRGLDMQSIVATLQREQYEIIRLPMTQSIIIQGSAGSGKSAIALHRLSYLLYKYQNLKPDRVAILGPNKAFLKHIQNVLPTLGDFGIKQTTFLETACDILMLSPSKVKRHQAVELEIIKMKGSLDFRNIVQHTTMNMFNDLRIWAKTYTLESTSIPIVPILREMEKYPQLTLKERENLYFNFFLKSLQQELQNENKIQKQLDQWVKEKAKSIQKQEAMNLPLYQDDFITPEITQLGNRWVEHVTAYKAQRSDATKKQADSSRKQFIAEIQHTIQSKMESHCTILQQLVPQSIDDTIVAQALHHHMQCEMRNARESIILEYITEYPVEVLSVDALIQTSIVQQRLEGVRERVLQQLERGQQAFFKTQKDMLQEALMTEILMMIERDYYKQIKEALKIRYNLEFSFSNNYPGYTFKKEHSLSTDDRSNLKRYVKNHLKLDYFDCFDEAIRVAKSDGLLPNDYQSRDTYYEDLPALLHIARLIHGVSKEHMLSYLIVDEAQDYMPYEIVELNALTQKNGLMLIGDLGQNLNRASSLQDWHSLDTLIGGPAYYELQATYRSTAQIAEIGNEIIQPFATGKYKLSTETFRDGAEVEWVEVTAASEEQKLIAVLEEAIFTYHYESIAVVVKDESLLEHYQYMIDPYFSVVIQTTAELPTNVKVVVTTSTAVKGLEFEAVVISSFNDYSFTDFDRKLAYVATSRALHQLYIMFEQGRKCLLSP